MVTLNEMQSLILYLACFFVSILTAMFYRRIFGQNNEEKKQLNILIKNLSLIIIIMPLAFLAAIRYGVGTDYFTYIYLFNEFKIKSITEVIFHEVEPLFKLLYIFSDKIFGSTEGFFFLTTFLTLLFMIKSLTFYERVLSITFAIFIYYCKYYGTSLNGIRQMLAVSVVLYSYKYLIDKNIFKYILFVVLASFIHTSALVTLPLYLFNYRKSIGFKFKKYVLYIIVAFTPISMFLGIAFLQKLNISRYFDIYSLNTSAGGVGFLIYLLPVIVPLLIWKKHVIDINPNYEVFYLILILQIPFMYLGYYSMHISRIALYFSIIEIILVPLMIKAITKKEDKVIWILYFVFWYILYFIYMFCIKRNSEIFPFIFNL